MTTYNYDKLMSAKPTTIGYTNGIRLVEHPYKGDEAPLIAIHQGKAWCTGFYDLGDIADKDVIVKQAANV